MQLQKEVTGKIDHPENGQPKGEVDIGTLGRKVRNSTSDQEVTNHQKIDRSGHQFQLDRHHGVE